MTSPSATLLVSINGGATTTGGITGALLDTVDMSAQSTIGWAVTGVSAPRWEIYGYPPSFSVPSGYSTDGVTGAYYYVGLTPPQFTMSAWGKYMLRLIVNGGGGSLTDESTSVRVYAPSGLDDLGRYEKAQFSQDWTDGYRANLRIINSGLGVAKAPADAQYLVGASNADLTSEVVWTSIVTTVAFASTATIPCSFKRTSATTNAAVDAHKVIALSSGTAVVGFGVGCVYQGANTSGAAIDYGRIKFTADDLTGGSESTRMVVQCTTAGSMVNAFEVTGTSAKLPAIADGVAGYIAISTTGVLTRGPGGGGVDAAAHVWEDASTALATNGVPTRNLAASLSMSGQSGVVPLKLYTVGVAASDVEVFRVGRTVSDGGGFGTSSTIAHMAFALPNGSGTETKFAAIAAQLTSTIGPSGKMILRTLNGGSMSDWVTIGNAGAIRFHGSAYANNGYRLVVDGSGNITASIITSSEVTTALGYTPVTNARTLTGTSPITIAGDNAAHDLSADRTIAFSVGADIAWNGHGITGIATLDNSGGTQTYGANTTGQTAGKAGTTWAFPGAVTIAQTTGLSDVLTLNKDALGTTKTVGQWLYNATNSGTQVSPMLAWSAWNGGTRVNIGAQWEPQSTSAGSLVFYAGTGSTAPATKHFSIDTQNNTFGSGIEAYGFYVISGGLGAGGLRFFGNNNGGYVTDGSDDWLLAKSYNTKGFRIQTGADSGGTGGVERFAIDGSGKGRAVFVPHSVTSSSNAVTFPLATCQNIRHTTTENTTVTFSGATPGMRGTLDFIQGVSGKTITMPTNGVGVEYDNSIGGLGVTAIVDATGSTRTVLQYYVTDSPATRVYIYARSVSTIP